MLTSGKGLQEKNILIVKKNTNPKEMWRGENLRVVTHGLVKTLKKKNNSCNPNVKYIISGRVNLPHSTFFLEYSFIKERNKISPHHR